jgi:hypothetical protein
VGKSKLTMNTQVAGGAETIEALRGVKFGVGNRVLVAALRKQAGKTVKTAKSLVQVRRTGLLAKSVGSVYRKPKRGNVGGGVFVVGPRKSFAMTIEPQPSRNAHLPSWGKVGQRKTPKLGKRLIQRFKGLKVNPAKYAHLVEGGRRAVGSKNKKVMSDGKTLFGRKAKGVAAKPFMRPAMAALNQSGRGEIAADVKAGIAREAAKYAAKGKSIYGATP